MPRPPTGLREFAEEMRVRNLDCLENIRLTNGMIAYVKRTDMLNYSKEDHEKFIYLYNKDGSLLIWFENGEWMHGYITPNQISIKDLERIRGDDYRSQI